MYARPAGMSEDEAEDNDDFSYESNQTSNRQVKRFSKYRSKNAVVHLQDKERSIESYIVNACTMGDLNVIKEHLNVNNINNFLHTGWTPLLYAASSIQRDIIEYLLFQGANPNIHNDGYTPLMAVCKSTKGTTEDCLNCLTLLIEAKADVNAADKQKVTALMYACQYNNVEIVSELIKHVEDIDVTDNDSRTALMYAVLANKPDIVQILLENKANSTLRERNNLTATDLAAVKGYEKILSLLNTDEVENLITCEISKLNHWTDMFIQLNGKNNETVNYDVAGILYGMGLEKYTTLFKGVDLATFLQLTEEDLSYLGMDISAHRKKFIENLYKFHNKKWNIQSLGTINTATPYTIFDGVISLGNASKQIDVIGSSFHYIRKNLLITKCENLYLSSAQISEYEEELKKTQENISLLTHELLQLKTLADKIKKENSIDPPPMYIVSKKKKISWTTVLSVTVIIGMLLSKTSFIHKLWNDKL